jgi:hypothetical protein
MIVSTSWCEAVSRVQMAYRHGSASDWIGDVGVQTSDAIPEISLGLRESDRGRTQWVGQITLVLPQGGLRRHNAVTSDTVHERHGRGRSLAVPSLWKIGGEF